MSREAGDEFEAELAKRLNLKLTANSGAIFDDADLRPKNGKKLLIEAKVKNTLTFPFTSAVKKEIKKLEDQASERFISWIYMIRCISDDYVILDLNTFEKIAKDYFADGNKEKGINSPGDS